MKTACKWKGSYIRWIEAGQFIKAVDPSSSHNKAVDPSSSHYDFLDQMLSNLPSSSWPDLNPKPFWNDTPPPPSHAAAENVALQYDDQASLASKFRNHQISSDNGNPSTKSNTAALMLQAQQQLLMSRGLVGAGDSGLLPMPLSLGGAGDVDHSRNDVVDGSSFKSPNPVRLVVSKHQGGETSVQALYNGFAGSLHGGGQVTNHTQQFPHPQVTRLKCGGFILAVRLNHTISDALGFIQFMKAIAEISQGAPEPSITPVWCRELLNAREPPRITHTHLVYDEVLDDPKITTTDTMSYHSFFLGPNKIKAIHQMFPHNNQHNTRFEILAAFLWRCRTKVLQLDPDQEVRFICVCNARTRSNTSFVPQGYYGNAILHPTVATTARKLCENSLGYALELVKKAKAEATAEYLQSVADLMVIRGRPGFVLTRSSWLLSDLTRVGFRDVDFGWGKAVYGGPAMDGSGCPEISHFIACKNAEGEEGIVVQFYLPPKAMKMMVEELDNVLGNNKS